MIRDLDSFIEKLQLWSKTESTIGLVAYDYSQKITTDDIDFHVTIGKDNQLVIVAEGSNYLKSSSQDELNLTMVQTMSRLTDNLEEFSMENDQLRSENRYLQMKLQSYEKKHMEVDYNS